MNYRSKWRRFFTLIFLFVRILWAFYIVKYKKIWHQKGWADQKYDELAVSQARLFRVTAVKMGGLLIKLGQFFSTRIDILPQSSVRELSGLQDEVQAVAFAAIKAQAESEFKCSLENIFAALDEEPIASASLGQVHQATLKDGRIVAVKIQRPGIDKLIDIDLKAIHRVIEILKLLTDWQRFVDFDDVYEEFAVTIRAELDYIEEGRNAETIAHNSSTDKDLLIPAIIWECSNARVLTMEYMHGVKINDYSALEKTGCDRRALAGKLLQIYVKQVLIDGFYHADPHPGNILVDNNGRIIMIDFGMVGRIPDKLKNTLLAMVIAMVKRDYPEVVNYFKEIGFLRIDTANEAITRAVSVFIEHILGSQEELSRLDLRLLLKDLEELLYEQPFQVPANFTFLGRALGTLYGLCIGLDPEIDFLQVAKPYIDQVMPGKDDLWQFIKEKAPLLGSALIEIPPLAERFLRRAERGDINLRVSGLQEVTMTIAANTRAINHLSRILTAGLILLSSLYLMVNGYNMPARYGFYLCGLVIVTILWNSRSRAGRSMRHPSIIPRKKTDKHF